MKMQLARCLALGLALVGFLAASAAGPALAQQTTPLKVSVLPILTVAPFYAAVAQGYFKAEGFDLTIETPVQGGAVGIPGLVAGAYDVVFSNSVSVLLALQQGIDLRIIAGIARNPAEPPEVSAIVGRSADNLHTGKDLEGKSIGVAARGDVQWLFARAWMKATGGDPDKATFREVPLPQMVDAMKQKQIDSAVTIDPFLSFAKRDPSLTIVAWPFHVVAPRVQIAVYAVTADTAKNRPEIVDKFVRVLGKGAQWEADNLGKESFLKMVSDYSKMNPDLIATMPTGGTDFDVDVASLRRMAELMRDNGMLTKDIDLASKVYAKK